MLIFFRSHLHIVCCAEQNDRKEEDDRHNNERSELSAVGEIRTRRQGDDERDDDDVRLVIAHDRVDLGTGAQALDGGGDRHRSSFGCVLPQDARALKHRKYSTPPGYISRRAALYDLAHAKRSFA